MLSKTPLLDSVTETFDPYARSASMFQHSALVGHNPFDGPVIQNVYVGTTMDDNYNGTNHVDSFDMSQGGNDTVKGKGGDDFISFGAAFTADDKVDGGSSDSDPASGSGDSLDLNGDYSAGLTFHANTVRDIEELTCGGSSSGGGDYKLTLNDGNVAAGAGMAIYLLEGVTGFSKMWLDASAETDGDLFIHTFGMGDDTLIAGSGNDYINAGRGGTDYMDGGAGINRASFASTGAGVTVSLELQGAPQDVGGGRMVTILNFTDLGGSTFNDTLTGDGNANWLYTVGGSDTINGEGGDDFIEIDDTAHATSNTVDGGADIDTLSFNTTLASTGGITFSLANHTAGFVDGLRIVTAFNFENVTGSINNDKLTGDAGDNVIYGDDGKDTINAGAGNDTLYGDAGYYVTTTYISGRTGFGIVVKGDDKDTLNGADGNDTIFAGGGNDKITGGAGVDTMNGEAGADSFVFKKANESGVGVGNRDVIDFSQGDHDTIDLHGIDADSTTPGDQAFFLGSLPVFTGMAGELIQNVVLGHTVLSGDVNGDTLADFEIELTTAPTLVNGDFDF